MTFLTRYTTEILTHATHVNGWCILLHIVTFAHVLNASLVGFSLPLSPLLRLSVWDIAISEGAGSDPRRSWVRNHPMPCWISKVLLRFEVYRASFHHSGNGLYVFIWLKCCMLNCSNTLTPASHGCVFHALRCDPSRCVHVYVWTHRDGSQRNACRTHPCGAGLSYCLMTWWMKFSLHNPFRLACIFYQVLGKSSLCYNLKAGMRGMYINFAPFEILYIVAVRYCYVRIANVELKVSRLYIWNNTYVPMLLKSCSHSVATTLAI